MSEQRYAVIESQNCHNLAEVISEKLAQGWTLVGGIAVTTTPGGSRFYVQAMTYAEPPLSPPLQSL